jgi:hypothetical protein
MNRRAASLILVFVFLMLGVASGCRRKPAYSEIDANRPRSSENRSGEDQASTGQPGAAQPPATSVPQQPAAPPPPQFRTPSFIDDVKGDIKDLPLYPRGNRTNARIGPANETNMATFVLQTDDAMDKIVAFYDRAIKSNHWQVVGKTADPEIYEWVLVKGQDDSGRVQIKKDSQVGKMVIFVIRAEKLKDEKK